MGRRVILTALVLAMAMASDLIENLNAQSLLLRIRKEDSHVGFSIYKWAVFKEEGRFKDFDGTIEFDPQRPAATKVEIVINTSSIDSRNEDRDSALRSEEFFHVRRYPTMRFKSVGIRSVVRDTMVVEGDLTIRGITKRITLPVRIAGVNKAGGRLGTLVGFESEFTINREDFDVGEGWSIIDKEARIHLLVGAGTQTTASR